MAHEIVEKWRALQKGPRVPRPPPPAYRTRPAEETPRNTYAEQLEALGINPPVSPKTPTYDVKGIQSLTPSRLEREIASRYAPRIPQRRELTAQEMGSLYPQLVSKRPELLNRLAKRGVTYYTDPLITRTGAAGTYSPSSKEVTVETGQGVGVAAHEIVHAYQATSWINPVRFLVDKRYRAARSSDLVMAGDTAIGKVLQLALVAAGGDPAARVGKASYQSEVFAMGAYGTFAYPDLPVDYTEANYLFGGSFER